MRCAVIGAGAWGTALADLLASNGHDVGLWAHEPDVADTINTRRENRRFLPGALLSERVSATTMLERALDAAELVLYVTPSSHLRPIVRAGSRWLAGQATLGVASKGIERDTLAIMSRVIQCELGSAQDSATVEGGASEHCPWPVVALSGPSFAQEVAAGQPTAIVAASASSAARTLAQRALSSSTFRVYTHDDVVGVELGGALKNVIAVATGIMEGVGLGANSRAALMTRGLAEMTRLGCALGARPATFAGLAGLGDLVLTCTGALSRNRALGLEVGRGATMEEALAGKDTVAEGVVTTVSAVQLAQRERVEMPIAQMVYRILFERHPAREAVGELMARELRAEQDP